MHPIGFNSTVRQTPTNSEKTAMKSSTHRNNEARAMMVSVNDKSLAVADATTLTQLLDELGLSASKSVAVAINSTVVPRSGWLTHRLADGDHVLVIQATQGG
jgi:sulfur carrier protein